MQQTPFYVAGQPASSGDEVLVRHPYDGRIVGCTSNATPEQVEQAVAAAAGVGSRPRRCRRTRVPRRSPTCPSGWPSGPMRWRG